MGVRYRGQAVAPGLRAEGPFDLGPRCLGLRRSGQGRVRAGVLASARCSRSDRGELDPALRLERKSASVWLAAPMLEIASGFFPAPTGGGRCASATCSALAPPSRIASASILNLFV